MCASVFLDGQQDFDKLWQESTLQDKEKLPQSSLLANKILLTHISK